MFCNSTITDLFLFVFTQLILHYPKEKYSELITDINEMYETKLLLQEVLRYYIYQELEMEYDCQDY